MIIPLLLEVEMVMVPGLLDEGAGVGTESLEETLSGLLLSLEEEGSGASWLLDGKGSGAEILALLVLESGTVSTT